MLLDDANSTAGSLNENEVESENPDTICASEQEYTTEERDACGQTDSTDNPQVPAPIDVDFKRRKSISKRYDIFAIAMVVGNANKLILHV